VSQQRHRFPLLQQDVPTMTSVPIVVTMCLNNGLGYHCSNCVRIMTPGNVGYLVLRKKATD
jgi:hypothetical protein